MNPRKISAVPKKGGIPWEARPSALVRLGAGLAGHFFSRSSTLSMWSATVAGLMLLRQA